MAHDIKDLLENVTGTANTHEVLAVLDRLTNYLAQKRDSHVRGLEEVQLSFQLGASETALEELDRVANRAALSSQDDRELQRLVGEIHQVAIQPSGKTQATIESCINRIKQLIAAQSAFDALGGIRALLEKRDQNCFLIVDRAGRGKTNLICQMALAYSRRQPTILLSGRHLLQDVTGIEKQIGSSLAYRFPDLTSFQSFYDEIEKSLADHESELLIFIDGINENRDIALMDESLLRFLSHYRRRRIRVCLTCRDIYWEFFSVELLNAFAWTRTNHCLSDFSEVEFNQAWRTYFRHYRIQGELVGPARERCRHPLLLRFFCEAYGDPSSPTSTVVGTVQQIRLKALFDDYWQKKIEAVTAKKGLRAPDPVARFLMGIGRSLRQGCQLYLDVATFSASTADPDLDSHASLYTMILDENLILEERTERTLERHVFFVYDEFMEYVMARDLLMEWDKLPPETILARLDRLLSDSERFRPLIGAVEFLSLMLKEEYGALVWKHLSTKSPRWHRLTLRAVAQLNEDELDDQCFEVLFRLAETGSTDVKVHVLELLGGTARVNPRQTVDLLEVLATDQSPQVRLSVIEASRAVRDPYRTSLLCTLVHDESVVVQLRALATLRENLPPEIPESLLFALEASDYRVRAGVIEMLPRFQRGNATSKVLRYLQDDHYVVRAAAVLALADIGQRSVVPLLLQALHDTNHIVRENILLALGRLHVRGVEGQLISFLHHRHRHLREAAVWALGQIASDEAERHLLQFTHGHDPFVRAAVIEALSHCRSNAAKEAVIRGLLDRDTYVRWQAAFALGHIQTEAGTRALVSALDDPNGDVRSQAVESLSRHSLGATEPLLIEASTSGRSTTRAAVLQALVRIGSSRADKYLAKALDDSSTIVQATAVELLGKSGATVPISSLIKLLQFSAPEIGARAVDLLSTVGGADLVHQYLEPMLEQPLPAWQRDQVINITTRILARESLTTAPDELTDNSGHISVPDLEQ